MVCARTWLIFASFAGLSACGSPPVAKTPEKCLPQSVDVSVLASASLNRSSTGEARPVVVRLYQLKSDARLYNASFERMWKDDKAALAEDLLLAQEIEVYPGTRTDLKFERPPAMDHLAAVALFANPTARAWVSILDLPPVPEAATCGRPCPEGDEECERANAKSFHLVYYVDRSKIEEGIEHLDEYRATGKMPEKR